MHAKNRVMIDRRRKGTGGSKGRRHECERYSIIKRGMLRGREEWREEGHRGSGRKGGKEWRGERGMKGGKEWREGSREG